ncbi:MAG TPA: hypothetical protein VEK76_03685 [Candidatus Binatia bacterium]|nr:hypothetical protein [Candidatus Binatia bacterium]
MCGKAHSTARLEEERSDCGGTCILDPGEHNWHVCSACMEDTALAHPCWRNH